jgi:CHAD domain-containing protein
MDHCGAVRNCDVALDLLQQRGIADGASVSKLKQAREDSGKELRRYLKKERRRNHSTPCRSRGRAPRYWQINETPEENLRRILPALAEEFFSAGAKAANPAATLPNLHKFRLNSKRFRYTLALFEGFYGPEMSRAASALKGVQDRLGAINDCAVTMHLLSRDHRAVSADGELLGPRRVEFRAYWGSQFAPAKLASWKRWLSHPSLRHTRTAA